MSVHWRKINVLESRYGTPRNDIHISLFNQLIMLVSQSAVFSQQYKNKQQQQQQRSSCDRIIQRVLSSAAGIWHG